MSGQATGWVLRHGPRPDMVDRTGRPYGQRARGLRTVLVAVADAANADGHHAHPGLANLEDFTLYSRRQVISLVKELVAEGWLVVEQEGGGRGRATKWTVVGVDGTVQPPHVSTTEEGCSDRTDPNPETVQSERERVQSEAETVQSRLHPNGVTTGVTTTTPPSSPPSELELVTEEPPPPAECDHRHRCEHFDAFWDRYPRRIGLGAALKAFRRAATTATTEDILDGLDRSVKVWRSEQRAPRFLPHPATWLNQQRWLDDEQPAAPTSKRAEAEQQTRAAGDAFLDRIRNHTPKELTDGVA